MFSSSRQYSIHYSFSLLGNAHSPADSFEHEFRRFVDFVNMYLNFKFQAAAFFLFCSLRCK